MKKKNLNWFIRCALCVEEFFPYKIWWLKNSQKIAFFANFKTEFIFANDGNLEIGQNLRNSWKLILTKINSFKVGGFLWICEIFKNTFL